MSLLSQPGSDYQLTRLTLDAGNARDVMLLLLDIHAAWITSTSTAPSPTSPPTPRTTCANQPAPTPSLPSSAPSPR
jgi:hypothetical protein